MIKIIFAMAIMLVLATPLGTVARQDAPTRIATKIDNGSTSAERVVRPCRCGDRVRA